MNARSDITEDLRLIPLAGLTLSTLNTRSEPPDAEIDHLADSLAVSGLLQNLLGFDPGTGQVEIVAGGRRLRALQLLADEGWGRFAQTTRTDPVPVRVTDDPLVAKVWASAENEARADLHPADQIRAYRELADKGLPPDSIARAFSQTERHVRQRLALAALPPLALDALRADRITLDLARKLTALGKDTQRIERVLQLATAPDPNKWEIDRALKDGRITSDDRRAKFVGLDTYRAEGGKVTEDLFEDKTTLHDEALLDTLFKHALDAAADRVEEAEGWLWVQPVMEHYVGYRHTDACDRLHKTPGDLPDGDIEEMDRLSDIGWDSLDEAGRASLQAFEERLEGDYSDEDRATGGVFVCVDRDGALTVARAFRKRPDKTENTADAPRSEKKPAPPIAQAALDDMARIETIAFQHALIDKPELVLDLLAFQFARRRPAYDNAFAIQISDAPTDTSTDPGDSLIVDQRWADTTNTIDHDNDRDIAAAFRSFREQGKKHRNGVLARHLACSFQRPAGSTADLGRLLVEELGIDVRKHWTPDAGILFKRCSAAHLTDLYAEILQLDQDDDRLTAFAAQKKGEKASALHDLMHDMSVREALGLSREDNARIDAWLPETLRGMAR